MIKNAGIVLLNGYVGALFERLGLLDKKAFRNETARESAVHYLQYIVTGSVDTSEPLLSLNKILCGLPESHPVQAGVTISEEHEIIIDNLIKAAVSHWPAIGACSISGFRENWLIRNGTLVEQDERWELTVEKRAYDILIQKSPFSFSVIQYTWMRKPVHVFWPH